MSITMSDLTGRTVTPLMDCLIWLGEINYAGYGRLKIDGKNRKVHRLAWELKNGPILSGLEIDHICRVRSCINTDHMELVTHLENVRRSVRFRFRRWGSQAGLLPAQTHCAKNHEYPADRPPGHSHRCPVCRRERERARAT